MLSESFEEYGEISLQLGADPSFQDVLTLVRKYQRGLDLKHSQDYKEVFETVWQTSGSYFASAEKLGVDYFTKRGTFLGLLEHEKLNAYNNVLGPLDSAYNEMETLAHNHIYEIHRALRLHTTLSECMKAIITKGFDKGWSKLTYDETEEELDSIRGKLDALEGRVRSKRE